MSCSFRNRHPDSLTKCLKRKNLSFLSREKVRQYIDLLTAPTENRYILWLKYFHVRYAYRILSIYLGLLILALLSFGFTVYYLKEWWSTPNFENVTSFGVVCLVIFVLLMIIAGFRDYLRGIGLIRKWYYTKWISIDDWKKMKVQDDESIPEKISLYLEKLSEVNSELKVCIQYTLEDGVNSSGAFLIVRDSRTYEIYFAKFWH